MINVGVKLAETLNNDWKMVLNSTMSEAYFQDLALFLDKDVNSYVVYPPIDQILAAFHRCSFEQTKVVIIGQDPYHGAGQAQGLSFSVPSSFPLPPSLRNIYKELYDDLRIIRNDGDLRSWADQGVLLLNAVLTVRSGEPNSHATRGWEEFTQQVIQILNEEKENVVFVLWGAYAQKLGKYIDPQRHFIIQAAHPSPLSANRGGFFKTKPFSKINQYLTESGQEVIDWAL
ncbi:uracil-DNA glycosylase [Aquirufa antheringensis]|uniref:uracil-DNA glycosylase n=1 Tax=Aquirufa antheringensis TaxID=2516559 RepID=UPI0022A87487|nr:uracil-DNA glycosylase [Aquirufa antheringensis]MCZ2476664.1 uracil-DNA glycosylase [Aquirufa antheringensis]